MVDYSALSQRDDKLALELLARTPAVVPRYFPRFNGTEIKPIGDARFWSRENCAEICVTRCATPGAKNGQIRDYVREPQQLVNDFKYSESNTPDVVRRFQQKCAFAMKNPLFYPLNYGNNDRFNFRFSTPKVFACSRLESELPIANCGSIPA